MMPWSSFGQIGGGHALEQESHGRHDQQIDQQQIAQLSGQDVADQPHVQIPGPEEDAVEPPEKGAQEKDRVVRRFMPLAVPA